METDQSQQLKHRDLNWLSFNERVLQEAEDREHNPLYERMKFLAIYSSNLDEYFRVRVSQLRQMKRIEKSIRKKLSLQPNKTVKKILARVKEQQEHFGKIFKEQIIPDLAQNHIKLVSDTDFTSVHGDLADIWYTTHLKNTLKTKLIVPSKNNSIFIENQTLYFCVTFEDDKQFGFVKIPTDSNSRFVDLGKHQGNYYITFIDDIIRYKVQTLFDHKVKGVYEMKLSRDAELYIDDELDGILAERIYKSLEQRQEGQPTRLLYDSAMPKEDVKKLRKLLNLGKIDMMPGGRYHNFNDFLKFPDPTENPDLHYDKKPYIPHKVLEQSKDYFKTIRAKDQLVHFPFMTFNYIERLVKQAATDPDVTHIKISLYRVADESILTTALLQAIDNGKDVTIFIEAKARFDEENNISWGRKFEDKGGRVIYSYPRIKVHSKILMIIRNEEDKARRYAYIGTGNFNGETSKIYCDHGLFTAHSKITKEIHRVFRVLEGELIIPRNKHLLISPFTTRRIFEKLIQQEIDTALAGKPAAITAKMNSLEDTDIIALLYKASQAGVKIRLIVRGFTCLIPGVEGLSENIEMTSIVDRYLEHGRIYLFHNGGDEQMYMGSADWMTRNLDRRIEVLTPIYDEDLFKELRAILLIQLQDNVKARIQDAEESNAYIPQKPGEAAIRSQYAIYDFLKAKN
ncbi:MULTISPECIES: polyphosphate kinase 1 [unclassified Leeuwenhoekiella]|uniref:polyphosphate kinase 1 n=1 Tax=unclassified Leeuwenhoekiella TaxID=2615029 RepID=UPI000C3AF747|nr:MULTISPECIES: polyphosphate kinase 1 [unclassified Leeuwenhoekiella]MAW93784.1 polyphosphate kinase 1 [Leeuwenhoekiella sp.]MBA80558.1 polyphosphate kinase 1 [Leeuwenhoekiella sp.]|tara:strand:+ start:32244 stop:34292 length:2049 start_codon:yes stop_codon:yes gene_type:complete